MKSILVALVACGLVIAMSDCLDAADEIKACCVSAPLAIDGKLDEPAWQGAQFADNFTTLRTTNASLYKTSAAILYDNDNLYIGIICKTTNTAVIKAKVRGNEEEIFQDDEVEVMIDPRAGGHEYLHVAVNAAGSRFDAWRTQKGNRCDASWGGAWQAATRIGEKEWICEMMIPFALPGVKEGATAPWRINICRHAVDPAEYSSLAVNGSFNEPEKFTRVSGLERIKATSPKPVYHAQKPTMAATSRDGRMYCQVHVVVTNASAVDGKALVRLEECENNKWIQVASEEVALRGSEAREVVLDSPVVFVPMGRNLVQAKPLKVVIACDDARQTFKEQLISVVIEK